MALPHFYALVLFSFLVSVVFGVIAKDAPRDRLLYGAKSFGLFVGIAVLIGWIMYFLPHCTWTSATPVAGVSNLQPSR